MLLRALGVFTGRGRRVPRKGFTQLTSKLGPKNFYKGKGVPSTGHHTRKGEKTFGLEGTDFRHVLMTMAAANEYLLAGTYVILKDRLPDYVVPDLSDFKVQLILSAERVLCDSSESFELR